MLQRINYAIDRIMLRDLSKLASFCEGQSGVDNVTMQSFVNAGLAYVPVAKATTDIKPNEALCHAFIKHVLK